MRRVEPARSRARRTGLSDAAKVGEPAYPVPFLYPSRMLHVRSKDSKSSDRRPGRE